MSIYLFEGRDFEWEEHTNRYGFTHSLPIVNGKILNRIAEPSRNKVVYRFVKDKKCLIPVLIKDGDYLVNGRLSNFWYWIDLNEDLSLGEEQSGYGGFFETIQEFKVNLVYNVTI